MADRALNGAIAVTRFGLGARPGEIEQASADPVGWLRAQIRREGADAPVTAPLPAMPATRLAFTVIDRGVAVHADLAREAARYAGSDTLCYPVEFPRALAEQQAALWTPWRDWARETLGLRFETAGAALHHVQPPETLAGVEAIAAALDPFGLASVVFACGLYGSAILALAVQRRALDGVQAFELSRLEEAFQAEQWGLDIEAEARAEALRAEAAMLERWFAALS